MELGGPEVSLVSGLEGVGRLWPQEVAGALWDGRKLVGWEQFWKYIYDPITTAAKTEVIGFQVHYEWKT